MKKAVKRISILVFALIFGGMILPSPAQTISKDDLVEIYDGGKSFPVTLQIQDLFPVTTNTNNEDKVFVRNAVKEQEAIIKRQAEEFAKQKCVVNPGVDTVLEGSFTAPNSSQKAYRYSVDCEGKSVYGLLIVENRKIVFNRFYSTIFNHGLKILPDINKNGLSELAIVWSTELGQHFMQTNLEMVECQSGNTFVDLGRTTASSSGIWLGESGYYKILAAPSANPKFFRDTYEPKDGEWVLTKKLEEFTLDKK